MDEKKIRSYLENEIKSNGEKYDAFRLNDIIVGEENIALLSAAVLKMFNAVTQYHQNRHNQRAAHDPSYRGRSAHTIISDMPFESESDKEKIISHLSQFNAKSSPGSQADQIYDSNDVQMILTMIYRSIKDDQERIELILDDTPIDKFDRVRYTAMKDGLQSALNTVLRYKSNYPTG